MESSRKSPCSKALLAHWHACADKNIRPGQTLVVGLSDGVDSMTLLHLLSQTLAPDQNKLRAVHVNHGLSASSDAWAATCQLFCDAADVPLTIVRVKVDRASKDGLEGAARRVRHDAYAQAGGDWTILAHHRGDQAETLLFNLLRGSGVRGAGAMRQRQGRLLRPWLDVGRDEIERYARHVGLQWIEDESNVDERHSRNFLRHRVLPVLRERFPAAEARLAAASRHFAEAQELLDELAQIDLGGAPAAFPLKAEILRGLGHTRAKNLLAYLMRTSGVPVAGADRLTEALRQLLAAAPDRHPAIVFDRHQLVRRGAMIDLKVLSPNPATFDNNYSGEKS